MDMHEAREYMKWANKVIKAMARKLEMDEDTVRKVVEEWEDWRYSKENSGVGMRLMTATSLASQPQEPLASERVSCGHEPDYSSGFDTSGGYRCRKCGRWVTPALSVSVTSETS